MWQGRLIRGLVIFGMLALLLSLNACAAIQTPTPTATRTPRTYAYVDRALGITRTPSPLSASGSSATRQTIYVANTNGDGVVLRSSPVMDARTSTVYAEGTPLTMDAQINGWAHIVAPAEGYIPPQYWSAAPRTPVAASQSAKMYVSADGDGLYIRSKPDMEARVKLWPDGTEVTIIAQVGDWYQVKAPDGYVGYMPAQYLSSTPPATPVPRPALLATPARSSTPSMAQPLQTPTAQSSSANPKTP
jgi:SH3-like domain-containing protein